MTTRTRYVHKDDCLITRRRSDLSGEIAELFDADGVKLWTFPGDMTDAQILAAVAFANLTYTKGVEAGEQQKTRQIKAVLGIET